MSLLTSLLKLFKWNTTDETDLEQEFDIDKAMNDNWDKLDDFAERVNDAVIEIQDDIEEIQNKNTEQDETINTINESISSIQAKDEAQDTEIDKQSDLIQKLKDNCINVTTEEATSLQVQDASTLPAKLDVRGNQRQEAREGYNVLQNKLTSTTINGVAFTINEDKSITLNGTATNSIIANLLTGQYNDNDATSPLIIPDNITNYRLSGCPSGGSWSTYKLDIYAEDNELIATDLGEGANIQKESDTILNLLRVRIIVYAGAVLNNVTFYPMIIYGAENKPYEQYGASPSINYPSEIKAFGDNVNMFDKDNANKINATPSAGTIIESSNGKSFYLEIKPNTDYSISRKVVGQRFTASTTTQVPAVGVSTNQNVQNNTGNEIHIKAGENDKYLLVYYLYNSTENEEEILSSIKVEEGEEATAYSKYGQGSVEIKKINSNIMPILNLGKDWEYTENGIKNLVQNGKRIFTINLKKGQTVRLCFKALLNPSVSTTFTMYLNGNVRDDLSFLDFYKYELNKIYTKTYTATEDCELYSILWGNANNETFEFQLWANLENAEDYQQYEEQSYILDIQKPMLLGDYFVKEADGWKEVHIWNKLIFTGQENWNKSGASTDEIFVATLDIENGVDGYGYSNYFRYYGYVEIGCFSVYNNGANIRFCVDSSVISDINRFKTMLADKYASGDSVYVYYKLSTPNKLACTEAQSNILDQLSELPLFAGTNNIITAESLALMQMQYIADTQSYIDSKLNNINQQILKLAGGN